MSALGATANQPSVLVTGQSRVGINPPAAPRDIQIPFVQIFNPRTTFQLSYEHPIIRTLFAPFETVTFVSLDFNVEVTGQHGKLQFAATNSSTSPATDTAWLGAHVHKRFAGNAQGDTFAEYSFPSEHRFGLELKATALGNDPPKFYFRFLGSSGDLCTVSGCLVVSGGGYGLIQSINLTELVKEKSSSRDSAVSSH